MAGLLEPDHVRLNAFVALLGVFPITELAAIHCALDTAVFDGVNGVTGLAFVAATICYAGEAVWYPRDIAVPAIIHAIHVIPIDAHPTRVHRCADLALRDNASAVDAVAPAFIREVPFFAGHDALLEAGDRVAAFSKAIEPDAD